MSKLKLIPKHQIGGTYLPKYEYEWNMNPQGVSVEKHQRVPENQWKSYWANQGANSVNKAMNNAGKNILDGLMTASYFTPMGNVTYGTSIAADILNGNTKDALQKAAIGIIPVAKIRMLENVIPKTTLTRPKLTGNEILREIIVSFQGRNFIMLENPETGAQYSIQNVLKEFPKTQIKDLSGIKTYKLKP